MCACVRLGRHPPDSARYTIQTPRSSTPDVLDIYVYIYTHTHCNTAVAATGRTKKGTRQLCALELLKALQGCYKRTRACMYTYIGVEVGFGTVLYAFPSSVTPPTHNLTKHTNTTTHRPTPQPHRPARRAPRLGHRARPGPGVWGRGRRRGRGQAPAEEGEGRCGRGGGVSGWLLYVCGCLGGLVYGGVV